MSAKSTRVGSVTLVALALCAHAPLEAQASPEVRARAEVTAKAVEPAAAAVKAEAVAAQAEAAAARNEAALAKTEAATVEARLRFEQAVEEQLAAEKQGEGEEAQELLRHAAAGYSRVLELKPGAVAALYNLGKAQLALGDSANAAKSFELAASRPGSRRVFYLQQWADFLRDQERWDEAFRVYEEVVLLEPRLDAPHELLQRRYLELRDRDPHRLLGYLWRLVEGRQASRGADLALAALEAGWPSYLRAELLAAIAASFAQAHATPLEILESPRVRRLRRFVDEPGLGAGVTELLRLYASPGNYAQPFRWWREPYDEWTERRGLPRRDAIRAALRAIGDGYRERRETATAAACYRAAVDLADDPDPLTLRSLANLYVERRDLPALDALAAEYADPAGRLFAAKNRAYELGQLDKILEYHRALGQIYGSLAVNGRMGWGTTSQPTTALFQLGRAFDVARRLDAGTSRSDLPQKSKVDPDLTLLYAQGLEATGEPKRGLEVRLLAAERFEEVGDAPASQKVLRGVTADRLSPDQLQAVERYQRVEPEPAPAPGPKEVQVETTPAWRESVATVTRTYSNVGMLTQRAAIPAQPVRIEVPATVEWLDTGVDVTTGQSIELAATGRWSNTGPPALGPGGHGEYIHPGTIVASAPLAALVAKVGERHLHCR